MNQPALGSAHDGPTLNGLDRTLKVSRLPSGEPEIFHSIQGEGISLGTPSVFLRLAMCNLVCSWCDTKYTWDWQNFDYRNEVMDLSQEQVRDYILKYDCNHLVITGGEPLIQQKGLEPLVKSLKQRGFTFEVETNATIAPSPSIERDIDQWNVSPKLATSGNGPLRREVPEVLQAFCRLPKAIFKFVVVGESDLEEIRNLLRQYDISKERVILMPEGRTPDEVENRGKWLSNVCINEGYRFTPRLQILLWGDKRGT